MKYIFFDIECANCFHGNGKICSFGYVVTDEHFNILAKKDLVINPKARFYLPCRDNQPEIVLAYDEKEFKASPDFTAFYPEIRSLLTDDDAIIFGFSVMSDARYIKSECERYENKILKLGYEDKFFDYNFIDVQRIYTDLHHLENTPSLIKSAASYGVTETQDVHKSDEDALFTMKVMKGICEETSLSVEDVIKKYPNCKCWCKNGELDTEYTHYKEYLRTKRLSDMEQITNSARSNWMHGLDANRQAFSKYSSRVFIDYRNIDSPLSGKRICISNLYEEYHFKEMMNIVSILAKKGIKYTSNSSYCDIFVTYDFKDENIHPSCYRKNKALRTVNSGVRQIEFITFDEFIDAIGIDEASLSILDKSSLAPLRKIKKARYKA
ncbi:MAG: hypothetical protein J6B60_02400 [Clostridia bacterium]|nr:hypothetical protein [Clostridia bacterium]